MIYLDKNKQEIKDSDVILFILEDSSQPTGYSCDASNVKLCFWSEDREKYVAFSEVDEKSVIEHGEVINLRTENNKQ